MSRTTMRVGRAFGIAHAVLLLTGFSLVASDDALMESPAEGITVYFVDGPMTRVLTGGYLEVLGALCFLPFAVALARRLGLEVSVKTVQNHVSRVLAKLQARDRVEAVLRLREQRP